MENHIDIQESSSKRDRGFTLVELLIVIVILGILATVTVFAVRGITDKGQTSACTSDQNTLQTAVESYFAQYGGTDIPVTGGTLPTGRPATFTTLGATPEDTLKNAGFIRTLSTNLTVAAADSGAGVTPTFKKNDVIVDTVVTSNPCVGKITAG